MEDFANIKREKEREAREGGRARKEMRLDMERASVKEIWILLRPSGLNCL